MIVDVIYGFLGSGKTTFISRILREWGRNEKIVVLVNEFGDVDIDGALLREGGGNVVEMPSGCICCTLQADFRSQMLEIIKTFKPERVVVEPTGVATISQIRFIIEAQLFENVIERIHNVLVADVTGFMEFYRSNPRFVESQVKSARVVLLNKCDRVDRRRAHLTRNAISAINPRATVIMTEFGAVDWADYHTALSASPDLEAPGGEDLVPISGSPRELDFRSPGEVEDGLGYESFGCIYENVSFDLEALESFFHALGSSEMGEVVRAKGIFIAEGKGVLMELASGELSRQPVGAPQSQRISVIGKGLDREKIEAALGRCITEGRP